MTTNNRAQELQLLRQLNRQMCQITHSATAAILSRLESKCEAHVWRRGEEVWADITARGVRALGESNGQT